MKLKEAFENIDYDDLAKLRFDIMSGGKHIKHLISKRIEELERDSKTCAVCGKPILLGDDSFSLVFGNHDFKKKASFCAIDCLEYFIKNVKENNEKKNKKTISIIHENNKNKEDYDD